MKISCTQENLNHGLSIVSHIASRNSALPILNNVYIDARRDGVHLAATNLEIGVRCIVRGKVEQEGQYTIQSRLLSDYIALLPKNTVDMEVKSYDDGAKMLAVSCGNNSTKIMGEDASEFPLIPTVEDGNKYIFKIEDLYSALGHVIFAVSVSETRPEINGVYFSFKGNILTLASTDSYRLAQRKVICRAGGDYPDNNLIVPSKTLQELQRILGNIKNLSVIDEVEEILLLVSDNQIMFKVGSIELVSRLIEGKYPEYEQIIPTTTKTTAVLSRAELIKGIKTASLFARGGIFDLSLDFRPSDGQLVISAANTQVGENVSRLSSEMKGDQVVIVVNYRYLLDGIMAMDSEEVVVELSGTEDPCLVKPVGSKDDYLYIVMPLRQ